VEGADQRAFELPNSARGDFFNVLSDFLGELDPLSAGLAAKDGDAEVCRGHLELGDEARLEAGAQARMDADAIARRVPARDDHLFSSIEEGVDDLEQFFLCPAPSCEELEVIEDQEVALLQRLTQQAATRRLV
jgi:hypothetical protein